MLEPFADRNIGEVHTVMIGSGAHYIARLELLLGRRQAALSSFKKALKKNDAMGARPWLAWTQFEYAKALLMGKRVDSSAVIQLLKNAVATATELDMPGLHDQVSRVLEPLLAGAERLSNREIEVLEMVATGPPP